MKFNRNYRLTIDMNDGESAIVIEPPFTIDFSIQKKAFQTNNSLSLTIYNLNETTRQRIFQDRYRIGVYRRITLEAGYGDDIGVVYSGNLFQAYSQLVGADVTTNIISRDGFFDTATTQTNKTISEGTTVRGLINELVNDFPNLSAGVIGGDDITLQRPVVVEGNTYENIKKYSRNQVFVDNERVNILNPNEITDDPIFLINAENGLLETPEREEAMLTVTTLFEPRLNMGQLVELESLITPVYNGQYKVIGATHSGTISESVGGKLISKFNLFLGNQISGGFFQIG